MNRLGRSIVFGSILVAAPGCAHPQGGMQRAPAGRAAELDLLDAWAGTWDDVGEGREFPSGKAFPIRGVTVAAWKCGRQYLLEESSYDAGEEKGSSLAVRTYDPHAKQFRSWYFDGRGIVGHSTMTYDAAKKTWHVKTQSADAETCEPTAGEMMIAETGPGTTEWTFTEHDAKTHKLRVEMKGTSRRR